MLAVGCANGIVRVFQTNSLKYVLTLSYTEKGTNTSSKVENQAKTTGLDCQCVKFNEAANMIYVVYSDRRVNVWTMTKAKDSTKPSPQLSKTVVAHSDCIWDAIVPNSRPSSLYIQSGQTDANDLAESFDHHLEDTITCSADGTLRFWDFSKHHQHAKSRFRHSSRCPSA